MSGFRLRLVPTVAAATVIVLALSLGDWQLRRADEKRALEAQRERAEGAAPIEIGLGSVDAQALLGARVRAGGRFVPQSTVYIDNRTHEGRAGFHVVTALALDGEAGRHVLVLRGWVAADPAQRNRLPAVATPATPVSIEGIAEPDLEQSLQLDRLFGREPPPPAQGDRLWQNASLERHARWSGLALLPLVIRQSSALDDGLVRQWRRAGADVDKHLGYAFQWFLLAAATALLWLYFGLLRGRAAS